MNIEAMISSRRVQLLVVAVFISLLLIFFRGGITPTVSSNLGIEFVGGVQIPVFLEHSVDPTTLSSMVDTIKLRINKIGLSQANVQSVGNNEILVEIPQASNSAISNVESILREQGTFQAIIDGVQALNGSDIVPSSVGGSNNEQVTATSTGASWQIGFEATTSGAAKFSAAASGKAHYPVYLFLDRPTNAAILLEQSWYNQSGTSISSVYTALNNAATENGDNIKVVWLDSWSNDTLSSLSNYSTIIVDDGLQVRRPYVYNELVQAGYVPISSSNNSVSSSSNLNKTLSILPQSNLIASIYSDQLSILVVNSWQAIGLISGPELDPSLAAGYVSPFYQITGTTTGTSTTDAQTQAITQVKDIESVLSSGRLPVSTYVGSTYSVSASLGKQFLVYSICGLFLAIIVVGLLIVLRYRNLSLLIPIMLIDLAEVLITIAIVGTIGTISLATAAGIIALIGTAVDNQIIITDELLSKRQAHSEHTHTTEEQETFTQKLFRAFHIIFTTAAIAIVAMLPLLFSNIVEITGFALSTIIGIIVGVLITRPAYGILVEDMLEPPSHKHKKEEINKAS